MIRVGRAALGDVDQIAQLFNLYRVFYGQNDNLEGARRFLQERVERDESVLFLAKAQMEGRSDAKPVGFTQLYPSFSSVRMWRVWILNDLFVLPEARRQGAAKALISDACDFARQSGAKRLELVTAKGNDAAQALYESVGWVRDEGFYEYVLIL